MDKKEYTRVPGRGADGFFFFIRWKSKLYWGNNHLLLRNTNLSVDRYNRFFYDKIQSVTIQDSPKRRKNNFIWGCCAGFFASMLMIVLLSGGHFMSNGFQFFFTVVLILSIFYLSVNNILGPTCRFFIVTAIKKTEIHCLCRKKHADAFFTLLVEKINSIQGELQKEKVHALLDQEKDAPMPTISSNS
jgi:hypothetical protein